MGPSSAMAASGFLGWMVRLTVLQVSLHGHALEPPHGLPHGLDRTHIQPRHNWIHEERLFDTIHVRDPLLEENQAQSCGVETVTTTISLFLGLAGESSASYPSSESSSESSTSEILQDYKSDESVSVITTALKFGTAQVLPDLPSDKCPQTTGEVITSIEREGRFTSQPIIQSHIPSPSSLIDGSYTPSSQSAVASRPSSPLIGDSLPVPVPVPSPPFPANSSANSPVTNSLVRSTSEDSLPSAVSSSPSFESARFHKQALIMASRDIFANPIAVSAPPPQVDVRNDHPAEKKGVTSTPPIQTNKFFGNFLIGDQSSPTYTHPYSVVWAAGKGAAGSYGMAISHIEANQRVYGPPKPVGAASYFINPAGIHSLIISAKELGQSTALATDSITPFSARVHLRPDAGAMPAISFPLVQGMAFVTAQFAGATPVIQTGVFFRNVTRVTEDVKRNVAKFNFHLEDGMIWRVYAYATRGEQLDLRVLNPGYAEATRPFYGVIQIAKDPGNGEAMYDEAAGVWPTTVNLTGTANNQYGAYAFNFGKDGHPEGSLAMYALPHHVDSFHPETRPAVRDIRLQTTTKGLATAVVADRWVMVEPNLPTNMTFLPWDPERGSVSAMSNEAKVAIRRVAVQEASQNMTAQTDLDSMYFSGKALAKFALLLVVINDLLEDRDLAMTALERLKEAFGHFAANQQKFPLVYERVWGGVVSSGSYVTGDSGADFGNTFYNDHHFHYGYHVLAAACIGHLDPNWIPQNQDYVNMLLRDFANPSAKDQYFPQWRSFDWYHGHSWAHGLFASFDGKDQESSSEDMMQAYATKMWGMVIGDSDMAMRGNLQLAVLARSLQNYYLYTSDNTVQPSQFIGNKVAGILFENKCDHTTYFGANIEYIQGIHMIPLLPPSPFIRTRRFVREEWDVYFSGGRAADIEGGWKGIIFGNLATADPRGAWDFFNSTNFDPAWIDGGASLTYYLAYAAVMGGL